MSTEGKTPALPLPAETDRAEHKIPVRSERQAMDWSLVLASQGIETAIERAPERNGFALVVASQDYARAREAIRLYRLENRRWAWRQKLTWPDMFFDWGAIVWCLVLVAIHLIDASRPDGLKPAGMMSNAAVNTGEWWRTFTAVLLHADAAHLATNLTSGLVVWGLVMGRYGWGFGLLAAYLAGAGGNWAGWLLYDESYRSVGASGMVLGGLGLLAAQAFALWREGPNAYPLIWRGILGGVLLLVLLGLDPRSDVIAHLGGFLTGLLLGIATAFVPAAWLRGPRFNPACGLLLGGWVVLTWWLAL